MSARIGTRRVYPGDAHPVVYPGEVASAQFDQAAVRAALASARQRPELPVALTPIGWLVEPMPGWRARWLRWRYRLVGEWRAGPAKLVVDARLDDDDGGTHH